MDGSPGIAASSNSSDKELKSRNPATAAVIPPKNQLPTSSSNGYKLTAPPSFSVARSSTTAGAWAAPATSQPRAGPSGSQRGKVAGRSGSAKVLGELRRQSTVSGSSQSQTKNSAGGALDGGANRAASVISLGDSSDESMSEPNAVGSKQASNGERRYVAALSTNGKVATAQGSSSLVERARHQRTASSDDELSIGSSSARRPSHLLKRPRQSSPADPAIRTNDVDEAATAAKRASTPSNSAARVTTSAFGSNDQSSSASAHSSSSTRRQSVASEQTAPTGPGQIRASGATPRAAPSPSQSNGQPPPGSSQQVPPASGRRRSSSSSGKTPSATQSVPSASPSYRVQTALRKALGRSSPNGTTLNNHPPSPAAKNPTSGVSPTRPAAPSSHQVLKPKPTRPAPPQPNNAIREISDAPRAAGPALGQEAARRAAASSSSVDQATSGAPQGGACPAIEGQLPLLGRPDLQNRQPAATPQLSTVAAQARKNDSDGDDSDILIVSELPAVAAVDQAAPASRDFAGSDSSRSQTPQPASQIESSRLSAPLPLPRRNLAFSGSSTPEAGIREDQLEIQAGLLADEEDNEDEGDAVLRRRQYSRIVPGCDEEGEWPSVSAPVRSTSTARPNVPLNEDAKNGSFGQAPRRSHQVARAMSGGFAARKSTVLGRPPSVLPAATHAADGDRRRDSPVAAQDNTGEVSAKMERSSSVQLAALSRPAADQQARPIYPLPRQGVAKKSTVMARPPAAIPIASKPASASSMKRVADGPPSDSASDRAKAAKQPRRAAAAAADAAHGKAAPKARKSSRRRAGSVATSPAAPVLMPIAIAGDEVGKPASAMPQVASHAELEAQVEEFVLRQQFEQPWNRVIAGPSYDRLDEFSTDIQDAINHRERRFAELHADEYPVRAQYKEIFEQMILEANSKEYPPNKPHDRPKIRVCGPADLPPEAWSSPPFEFVYTNRVVYDSNIVPVQAPGCSCTGDCGKPENRKTCACLRRQIAASKTRVDGSLRSDRQDFAYDRDACLYDDALQYQEPIIECNSQCGCGLGCINRVVGKRKGTSVDIFWTGIAGWGVRLSKDYEGDLVNGSHLSSRVRKGAPLAIYAGELLRSPEAYARDDLVYSYIQRNYIYDLDHWTIGEEIKARAPPAITAKLAIAAPEASHKATSPQKIKKQGKGVDDASLLSELSEDEEVFSSFYSIDAYNFGNWTRFANHVCAGFNVVPRPVYVDEGDVTRPLWVYFASRDILPGEEINISYFGETEPDPQEYGMTDAEWIAAADKQREEAPPAHRCYCRKRLCRGRMFHIAGEMFWEKRNGAK